MACMTTGGSNSDEQPENTIIVLSNAPVRAQSIEQMLNEIPAFQTDTVLTVPVKQKYEPHSACPRMIVLDDENGKMDPLQWVKQVHATCPDTALVLIAPTKDPMLASRALRAGANAYISGDEFDTILPEAFAHIGENERYVSEEIMQGILHGMVQTNDSETNLPVESLSDREMMVFQLLGEGKIVQKIAEELDVNIKTIATHCNNIRRKLNAADNHQLSHLSRDWVAGRDNAEQP